MSSPAITENKVAQISVNGRFVAFNSCSVRSGSRICTSMQRCKRMKYLTLITLLIVLAGCHQSNWTDDYHGGDQVEKSWSHQAHDNEDQKRINNDDGYRGPDNKY